MPVDPAAAVPPGWVGGFAQSNPAFAYPDPDLASLPLLGNMDNIDLLQRQQAVLWPEFSWLTVPGDPASRAFQMFAPDISRVGYTDDGRIYSIICPQQGVVSPSFGALNVEVSVTGQRGWVDETTRTLAADMTVEAKVWFTPSAKQSPVVRLLWTLFADNGLLFPADKARAIRVSTHRSGMAAEPVFPVRAGEGTAFESPAFARHPAIVDQQEWREHAEKWRESIDADHGSPDGPGTSPRYFDGTPFVAPAETVQQETEALADYSATHMPTLAASRREAARTRDDAGLA